MADRKTVLEYAARMFLRNGIRVITMDDIANELGISKRTLYDIFESKELIISQIVDTHIQNENKAFDKILNQSENSIDMMLKLSKFIFVMYNKLHPSVLSDLKKFYSNIWTRIEKFHNDSIRQIIELNLLNGIKEHLYRENIDPVIISLFYVKQLQLFSDEDNIHFDKKSKTEVIQQFVDHNMYGLMTIAGTKYYEQHKNQLLIEL
jgi:TetR/AcrR family transcriptional regulator, cholesterol catabolism regulator